MELTPADVDLAVEGTLTYFNDPVGQGTDFLLSHISMIANCKWNA
jgi:hypothetical protein